MLEEKFLLLRREHPSELGFLFVLYNFLSTNDQTVPNDISEKSLKNPADIIVEHGENSIAMAGRLLKILSED
jgi:hypothetical protein